MTFVSSGDPLSSRQPFEADSINLKTIVKHAEREPLPLVLLVRRRTVANIDSIGLVVRK